MRLKDADALVKHLCEDVALKHFYGRTMEHAVRNLHYLCEFIDNAPTVDAVPVVRCKDCKYFGTTKFFDATIALCKKQRSAKTEMEVHVTPPDWFCADGERREENV